MPERAQAEAGAAEGYGRRLVSALRGSGPLDRIVALVGLAAFLFGTVPGFDAAHDRLLTLTCLIVALFFTGQVALAAFEKMRGAAPPSVRGSDVFGSALLIDLLAAAPVPIALATGATHESARLLGVFWSLKLLRASPALVLLSRVVRNERQSLYSVSVAFAIVLLFASTAAFLLEREQQPEQFASVPAALWWGVVTLTTTGYGDKIPLSFAGRVLAAIVMFCGIGLFALWAGILASGFSQELRRGEFLKAWDLVVQLPLLRSLGPREITAIARSLKVDERSAGSVIIRRGDAGDCMYFIAEGEVEVRLPSKRIRLGAGAFFGELALVRQEPRNADVIALGRVRLLRLDVLDFRELAGNSPDLAAAIEAEGKSRAAPG